MKNKILKKIFNKNNKFIYYAQIFCSILMGIRMHMLPLKNKNFGILLNPFFVGAKSNKLTAQKKAS